jgi:hypothetical protein
MRPLGGILAPPASPLACGGGGEEDKGPYALTPNTVELISALAALFSRGRPVQDPVLTGGTGALTDKASWWDTGTASVAIGLRQGEAGALTEKAPGDRLWEGTTRAKNAQGSPTQSHISPNILVYADMEGESAG